MGIAYTLKQFYNRQVYIVAGMYETAFDQKYICNATSSGILPYHAGNRHKQNSWFCKEIREDNFRFWLRRFHEDASQGMYMSKIEIFFFTAQILQNQRMLCCGDCFHD
jgi:hypothetical protein